MTPVTAKDRQAFTWVLPHMVVKVDQMRHSKTSAINAAIRAERKAK